MLLCRKYPANCHHRLRFNKLLIGKNLAECFFFDCISCFLCSCSSFLFLIFYTFRNRRTGKAPPPLLRGQPAPSRSSIHAPPPGILLPPTAVRSSTSSTGIPPNMVIPQPPHPRGRPPSATPNVTNYHPPADRTERSTKDRSNSHSGSSSK